MAASIGLGLPVQRAGITQADRRRGKSGTGTVPRASLQSIYKGKSNDFSHIDPKRRLVAGLLPLICLPFGWIWFHCSSPGSPGPHIIIIMLIEICTFSVTSIGTISRSTYGLGDVFRAHEVADEGLCNGCIYPGCDCESQAGFLHMDI